MRPTRLFVEIPKKCKVVGISDLFENLFADDFVDHAPSPTQHRTDGVRRLYHALRGAFSNFMQISIGSPPTAPGDNLHIMEHTMGHSLAWASRPIDPLTSWRPESGSLRTPGDAALGAAAMTALLGHAAASVAVAVRAQTMVSNTNALACWTN